MKRSSTVDLLREADVEKQIVAFLKQRDWRVIRHRPTGTRGYHRYLGEKGSTDFFAFRVASVLESSLSGFFLEVKKPGQTPSDHQYKWMAERQREGYRSVWCDSFATFKFWYRRHYN